MENFMPSLHYSAINLKALSFSDHFKNECIHLAFFFSKWCKDMNTSTGVTMRKIDMFPIFVNMTL